MSTLTTAEKTLRALQGRVEYRETNEPGRAGIFAYVTVCDVRASGFTLHDALVKILEAADAIRDETDELDPQPETPRPEVET